MVVFLFVPPLTIISCSFISLHKVVYLDREVNIVVGKNKIALYKIHTAIMKMSLNF